MLKYIEYLLRMLKCENPAVPNMMRMDGAGLVENDVFAKTLRKLADPYKCRPHCRILENGLHMLRTLTNNANALQTPYE